MSLKKTGKNPGEKLNKELEIILWAIREKEKKPPLKGDKLFSGVNWNNLITLSIKHGILPILYKKLRSMKKGLVPEEILSSFKSFYQNIVRWNMIHSNILIKLLKLFKENGINVIPIKGPVLSAQAYGDIGFRVFQDLDILIQPKDFNIIYGLLKESGFKPSPELSEKKKKLWRRFRRDIEFFGSKTILDIHQRLSQAHSSLDVTAEQFRGENFVNILNQKVMVLSPEDTILYMCINNTKDQWDLLRMIADLSYLLNANPGLRWEKLIENAKKRGILRMVLSGLLLLHKLTGERFPVIINNEFNKDRRINTLSEKYKGRILTNISDRKTPERVRSFTETLDSPFHKMKYLLYFIFIPTPEDFKSIHVPESLYILYHFIRPFRLLLLTFKNIRVKI